MFSNLQNKLLADEVTVLAPFFTYSQALIKHSALLQPIRERVIAGLNSNCLLIKTNLQQLWKHRWYVSETEHWLTVAFNNTPRSKANYYLRLLLSSINSVSKRDQEEDYFHELKSKRPLFVMSDKWFQSIF